MKKLLGLWPNLDRAVEVAILGNLSVAVRFEREYHEGFDDYQYIKEYYKEVNFLEEGDITVEISKPDYSEDLSRYEEKEDILKRAEMASKNTKPSTFVSSACTSLLDRAVDKLELSLKDRENIIKVSKVVAQLEGSPSVKVEHVAEAIHYARSPIYERVLCNPERNSIHFGEGIQVSQHELDLLDIENAIEYLTELKGLL